MTSVISLQSESAPNSLEPLIVGGTLLERGVYDALRQYGDIGGLTPIGRHIVDLVGRYYDLDDSVRAVPREVISERAARELTNPKHAEAVKRYLGTIPDCISVANVLHDIREHRRRSIGDKLSLALANRSPEIEELLKAYCEIGVEAHSDTGARTEVVDIFDTGDLTDDTQPQEELIRLWPKGLNDRCDGGAKRGHQILVYARPENGKTLVAINMVAGFVNQHLDVLVIANEEPVTDYRQRVRQRLLKVDKQFVRSNPQQVAELLAGLDIGRLRIAALAPGSFPEIKKLVEEFKPDVLVIDQLRNLRVQAGARVEELETAATEARNLAKRYGLLVVSITQAGESASNKVSLELSDVDGSKTGIPAQMDLMIGVGSTEAMRQAGILSISLPKNKLSGVHETFTCNYNKQTGVIH
jgi:KaiC/GvpD/RAD55 family RecA-like ATPase